MLCMAIVCLLEDILVCCFYVSCADIGLQLIVLVNMLKFTNVMNIIYVAVDSSNCR